MDSRPDDDFDDYEEIKKGSPKTGKENAWQAFTRAVGDYASRWAQRRQDKKAAEAERLGPEGLKIKRNNQKHLAFQIAGAALTGLALETGLNSILGIWGGPPSELIKVGEILAMGAISGQKYIGRQPAAEATRKAAKSLGWAVLISMAGVGIGHKFGSSSDPLASSNNSTKTSSYSDPNTSGHSNQGNSTDTSSFRNKIGHIKDDLYPPKRDTIGDSKAPFTHADANLGYKYGALVTPVGQQSYKTIVGNKTVTTNAKDQFVVIAVVDGDVIAQEATKKGGSSPVGTNVRFPEQVKLFKPSP